MTPEKLREKGNRWRELGQYDLANIYNQHAAALEEIERLNAAWKSQHAAWKAQQFHLEAEERESAHWKERAEKAERRAEHWAEKCEAAWKAGDELTMQRMQAYRRAERLKGHAEAMAIAWEKLDFDDGESEDAMEEAVFSYRAEFKEE